MSIVIAILIFALIITVHEIGHFSAARLFKMRVYEFSLGIGPTILKKRGKETIYSLKLIPFGGSCRLGEDVEETDDPYAFRNKPVWQRAVVIVAGAFMNMVLGLILSIIVIAMGNLAPTTSIHSFDERLEEPLSARTLLPDDKVIAVNGMRVFTRNDIVYQLVNTEAKMDVENNTAFFEFTVIRDGQKITLPNVEFNAFENEKGGISLVTGIIWIGEEKTFFNVISAGTNQAISFSRLVLLTLFDMIRGTYGLNDIAGPVGVVSAIGEVSAVGFAESIIEGIRSTLIMATLITVNVGIFNLLPIPALDGARLVFFAVEAVRRKPVKPEVEGAIHFVGFAALMLFMLFITVLDIGKLIG